MKEEAATDVLATLFAEAATLQLLQLHLETERRQESREGNLEKVAELDAQLSHAQSTLRAVLDQADALLARF
jgi:hypothetical protein